MKSLDDDDIQLLKDAWALLEEIRDDAQTMLEAKHKANGRTIGGVQLDFIGEVTSSGITFIQINAGDEGDWDTTPSLVSFTELRDIEEATRRYQIVADLVRETQLKDIAARSAAYRRKQYEKLKSEFDAEGGPM